MRSKVPFGSDLSLGDEFAKNLEQVAVGYAVGKAQAKNMVAPAPVSPSGFDRTMGALGGFASALASKLNSRRMAGDIFSSSAFEADSAYRQFGGNGISTGPSAGDALSAYSRAYSPAAAWSSSVNTSPSWGSVDFSYKPSSPSAFPNYTSIFSGR